MTVGAREPLAAAGSAVFLLVVCAACVSVWTVVEAPALPGAAVVSWAVVALLAVGAALHRWVPARWLDRRGGFVQTAVAGVLLVCLLRVVTEDASVGAHAFLTLPVLWAATHLRRGAVVLVTGTALAADAVTVLSLLPVEAALTDLVFSGAVLVVVASLLHRAAETQDRLVGALQRQAEVDALTGLVNRRVFDRALLGADGGSGGAALVLVDVDAFKTINDVHGHPVGDGVLVHLAAVLRDQVRAEDAVLARLGGDELAVLLPGCSVGTAVRRAEALLDAVRAAPVTLPDGGRLQLSISVGVAHLPAPAADLRPLYAAADAALYDAKRAGRGRLSVAAPAVVAPGPGVVPAPARGGQGVRRSPRVVG